MSYNSTEIFGDIYLTDHCELLRIAQLESTYKDNLVQLADHFRAKKKLIHIRVRQ